MPSRRQAKRVDDGPVAGAVVGEDSFYLDAVAAVEGDGSTEEAGRCRGRLIGEDFGVCEAAVVVDRDVHVLPAGDPALAAVDAGLALRCAAAADPVADAADPAEFLDVNVDELARPRSLVADRLVEAQPPQSPESESSQDPRDGRDRHRQRLGDLGCRHPQLAQLDDDRDSLRRRVIRDTMRCRRAVEQSPITVSVTANPLARAAHADTGGRGRRRQRPTLINDPARQLPPARRVRKVGRRRFPGKILNPWPPLSRVGCQNSVHAAGSPAFAGATEC